MNWTRLILVLQGICTILYGDYKFKDDIEKLLNATIKFVKDSERFDH